MTRGLGLGLAGLALLAGCDGPTGPKPPPPAQNITLTCPANIRMENVAGAAVTVNYPLPEASGGVPPITITCSPSSGTDFPVGTTTVNCQATDGVRAAVCTLSVTLVPRVPVLAATRFLAVGDSITAGENGDIGPDTACATPSPAQAPGFSFIDLCHSYPSALEALLTQRYTTQQPVVFNRGARGETTQQGYTLLPRHIADTRPDALLLLEGVNDLPDNQNAVIANLRLDIQLAMRSVKKVLLSTLLPLKPGYRVSERLRGSIASTNIRIRALAAEQGVVLVDNEAAFLARGDYSSLLADDGLHCTPEGYRVIAQTFLAGIQATLEQRDSLPLRAARRQR